MGGGGAEGPEGASSLELAIHWRIRRAWLNWGKRKGEGWWDQGRGWGGIDKVGEEGEVDVALVSEEVDESGEPSGGEGGEKVEREGRRADTVPSSVLRLYGRKDEGGDSGGDGSDIMPHSTQIESQCSRSKS